MNRLHVREVARREITTRARSKGYLGTTAVMLLLAIAAPVVLSLLPDGSDDLRQVRIGIESSEAVAVPDAIETLADGVLDITIVEIDDANSAQAKDQLATGEVDVLFRPPSTLVWDDASDSMVSSLIGAAVQQTRVLERTDELGISPQDLATAFEPVELSNEFLEGSSDTEDVRSGVAFFGLFLAFMMPQIFGQFTMMSVVEEKSTRVVEVLLSQIRPRSLLGGKIIGICTLAFVQLLVMVLGLVLALLLTDLFEVPASVWRFVPMLLLSTMAGLIMYTTMFALLGSLISRQEDQAQVMFPVFVPLIAGYFVGQYAAFGNAETLLVKVLTWVPFMAPMLLPIRVARDTIGPIEIVGSLALVAFTSYLLIRLAGRIYEFTLLRTGSRVGWKEVVRLSRGDASS